MIGPYEHKITDKEAKLFFITLASEFTKLDIRLCGKGNTNPYRLSHFLGGTTNAEKNFFSNELSIRQTLVKYFTLKDRAKHCEENNCFDIPAINTALRKCKL